MWRSVRMATFVVSTPLRGFFVAERYYSVLMAAAFAVSTPLRGFFVAELK